MSVSLLSRSAEVGPTRGDDLLLLRRLRITFGIGLAVAVALNAVGEVRSLIVGGPSPGASERWVYAAYVGVFVLGFLASLPLRARAGRSHWLGLVVTAGLLLVLAADTVLHESDYPPLAMVSLILFGAAALIPWTVPFQAALVGASLLAIPASRLLLGLGLGDPGWWTWPVAQSDPASGAVFAALGVALLGGVSIAITRTLYDLRERARIAERMGGYTLVKELGKGGVGSVFMAEHDRMCRPSAVKIISASPSRDAALIGRFQREIELASRLDHPNTIEIRDYGRAGESTFFLAMEYLVGLDLQHLVARFGPVPPERAIHILSQVCDSLAEAHEKGIVHRDLKPANVFLTRRGGICDFVKVLDFGLAKPIDTSQYDTITGAGAIVGTPHFMAPEVVQGDGRYGPLGDLYSLGCTAYWMLAGRLPHVGASAPEVIAAHIRKEPVPIATASEFQVPEILAQAIMRCMDKDPGKRFEDVRELKRTIGSIDLQEPWTDHRARAWWDLHLPEESRRAQTVTRPRAPSAAP